MRSKPPFFNVACGVLLRKQKVLIALREAAGYYGGYWEFPGGKIEKGESPEEGLCRELSEELGIHITSFRAWKELHYAYPERHVNLRFFLCAAPKENPQAIGCDAIKWVWVDDLGRYRFLPANQAILHDLKKQSRQSSSLLAFFQT